MSYLNDPGGDMPSAYGFTFSATSVNLRWNLAVVYQVEGSLSAWTQEFSGMPALALHTNGGGIKVGTSARRMDGKSYPGQLTFFPASSSVRFETTGHFRSIVAYLDPNCFSAERSCLMCGFTDVFAVAAMHNLVEEIMDPSQTGSLYADSIATALALHIEKRRTNGIRSSHRFVLSKPVLQRALDLLELSIESGISLDALAANAGSTRTHFAKGFKAAIGMGPHQYLIGRRIARACELLSTTDDVLPQIAICCGFSSQSHFNERFKHVMGCTPARYRMQYRNKFPAGSLQPFSDRLARHAPERRSISDSVSPSR